MDEAGIKEIDNEKMEYVEAEFVNIRQSTVRSIEGGHIEMQQVGALSIDGERIEMTQSAAAILHGTDMYVNQGVNVIAACNNANLNYSFAPVSLSKEVATIKRSAVGILGARDVKAENTSSILMVAGKVEGEVTTLLDWKSALAIGAVLGGIFGMLSLFKKNR